MTETHWAVCQVLSSRVHKIRAEIEQGGHGTFLPSYARIWGSFEFLSARERAALPGYVLFMTSPEGWGDVAAIEGVHRVLAVDGCASKVTAEEMYRIVIDHASGAHNEIALPPRQREKRRRARSRKPRPSRRARIRAAAKRKAPYLYESRHNAANQVEVMQQ